jgi:hypothetical protein
MRLLTHSALVHPPLTCFCRTRSRSRSRAVAASVATINGAGERGPESVAYSTSFIGTYQNILANVSRTFAIEIYLHVC